MIICFCLCLWNFDLLLVCSDPIGTTSSNPRASLDKLICISFKILGILVIIKFFFVQILCLFLLLIWMLHHSFTFFFSNSDLRILYFMKLFESINIFFKRKQLSYKNKVYNIIF